jgi:hypothetical protein
MDDLDERVLLFEKDLDSMLQKYHLTMQISPQFPTQTPSKAILLALEIIKDNQVVYKPVYSDKKD